MSGFRCGRILDSYFEPRWEYRLLHLGRLRIGWYRGRLDSWSVWITRKG